MNFWRRPGLASRVFVVVSQAITAAAWLGLVASLIALVGWSLNIGFFKWASPDVITAMLVSCAATVLGALFLSLKNIERYIQESISHQSLADGIVAAVNGKRIGKLRINAVTSAKILPIIQSSNCHIADCVVLLPYFDVAKPGSREDENNKRATIHVQEWRELARKNKIGQLEVRASWRWPDHYLCMFDSATLLYGLYIYRQPGAQDPLAVEFDEPLALKALNPGTAAFMMKVQRWFDETSSNGRPWPN